MFRRQPWPPLPARGRHSSLLNLIFIHSPALCQYFIHAYLVSRPVGRVTDLRCHRSCRRTRTLRRAASALQKCGDGALLGVPDGVITYRKENQLFMTRPIAGLDYSLIALLRQFLTHRWSCCHRRVAEQLLGPPAT